MPVVAPEHRPCRGHRHEEAHVTESRASDTPITRVAEGMTVLDVDGGKVGTVEEVRLGDPAAVTSDADQADPTGVHFPPLMDAFAADSDLDPQSRERLARVGYLRVDARGLFSGHRYVEAGQIAEVSGDRVLLSVPADQLLG